MSVTVCRCAQKEAGQALTESSVLLMVLAILWAVIPYLGDLSDISLKTQHLANLKIWQASKGLDIADDEALKKDLDSLEDRHRWLDLRGKQLLNDVAVSKEQSRSLASLRLGGSGAKEMRQTWQINDYLLSYDAQTEVANMANHTRVKAHLMGVLGTNETMTIRRRMALLDGAGHSSSREDTHQKIAQSETLWGQSMRRSESASKQVLERMRDVDAPWKRPEPSFSWLTPWEHLMPDKE